MISFKFTEDIFVVIQLLMMDPLDEGYIIPTN